MRKTDAALEGMGKHGGQFKLTFGAAVALIAINMLLLFVVPVRYFPLWVISSFVIYTIYFITMFIPLTSKKNRPPADAQKKGEGGQLLKKDKKVFGHIFWNLFFVTSETMFYGVVLLFGVDIVFGLYTSLYLEQTPWDIGMLLFGQSAFIIAFYALISWEQPYSRYFSKDIMGMKDKVKDTVEKRTENRWASKLAIAGFFIIILGFALFIFMWALMKPGGTLTSLMDALNVDNMWALAVIVISQLFIFRFLQGLYSKMNVGHILQVRKKWLSEELIPMVDAELKASPEEFAKDKEDKMFMAERYRSQVAISQVYTVAYMDMLGFLPIFLIGTDYGPLLQDDVGLLLRDNIILWE